MAMTLRAALLALGACSSSASPPPSRTPPPATDDAARATGDHAMIDQIQELIRLLSQDPLSVADVIARVGPVVDDPGIPQTAALEPASLRGVRAARLGRYPDTGLPYTLALELADDAQPTAAALRAAFGDYKRARTDRGHPAQLLFYPPAQAPRWQVALLADLAPTDGSLDDARVTRLTLRRDPRE